MQYFIQFTLFSDIGWILMVRDNLDWMEQAEILLNHITKFPHDSKIIMMLRHSEREPLSPIKKNRDLQLTENGYRAARIFGENLPLTRHVRIFYSIVDRCRNTALNIMEGFQGKGGQPIDGGVLEPLYSLKAIRDEFFKDELQSFSLLEIMNRWINEQYNSNDIESVKTYSERAATLIWRKLNELSFEGGIDIHVSHEVLLMALRSGWFSLSPDNKWTEFLGGFAFTFNKDHILLLDFDEFLKIPYPSWWKKASSF